MPLAGTVYARMVFLTPPQETAHRGKGFPAFLCKVLFASSATGVLGTRPAMVRHGQEDIFLARSGESYQTSAGYY